MKEHYRYLYKRNTNLSFNASAEKEKTNEFFKNVEVLFNEYPSLVEKFDNIFQNAITNSRYNDPTEPEHGKKVYYAYRLNPNPAYLVGWDIFYRDLTNYCRENNPNAINRITDILIAEMDDVNIDAYGIKKEYTTY